MADNFLERQMEKYQKGDSVSKSRPGLDCLLEKLRNARPFDSSYKVHEFQLKSILSVADRIELPSEIKPFRMAAVAGENGSFIVIGAEQGNDLSFFYEGLLVQAMMLKSVEIGLCSSLIKKIDADSVMNTLGIDFNPTTVLSVGKL